MQRGEDQILGVSETDSTTKSAGSVSSMEEEAGSRRAAAAAASAEQAFEESRQVQKAGGVMSLSIRFRENLREKSPSP